MFEIVGKYTTAKVCIDFLDNETIDQITTFVNHPAFTNPIVIQPDAHKGKGSCIGFTMPLTSKLIPNLVGVDISCGILSVNIGREVPYSLELIDNKIRKLIPFGMDVHDYSEGIINFEKDFPWDSLNELGFNFLVAYNSRFGTNYYTPRYDINYFDGLCERIGMSRARAINSIATVGSGNHFIELGVSDLGDYWLTVHTGSRNIGKRVCDYWQRVGIELNKRNKIERLSEMIREIREKYRGEEIKRRIEEAKIFLGFGLNIHDELQYLEGESAFGYLVDMLFCAKYAELNRNYIVKIILEELGLREVDRIETVHNYIDFKDFIIRKGSVRSYKGERFLLPFNMRDGILICEGKSNVDWNYSAPHGAGRVMSRAQAKKAVKLVDFQKSMEGIFSTSVTESTLDESPFAYKDAKLIENAIYPTATIINRIKPVMNLKDSIGAEND